MASLTDHTPSVAEDSRRWAVLDAFAATRGNDSLLWAVLPKVALSLVGDEDDLEPSRVRSMARNAGRALMRRFGPDLTRIGPILLVSTGGQNRRVLDPISRALEPFFASPVNDPLPTISPRAFAIAHRRATNLFVALRRHLGEHELATPEGLREEFLQTAIFLARSAALMQTRAPSLILVATQHNSATRAVLAAAHTCGTVRTAYVPHAPVADNPAYRDLPVHHALLRGQAEVDFYAALGTSSDRLFMVGDPSIPGLPDVAPPRCGPVVYAASTLDRPDLEAMIAVLAEADLDEVEVAPHPRMDVDVLRSLCPSHWTFNSLPSTYGRLLQGTTAVVQHSSGTGLEALHLGLAVVDLCHPGRAPNYPFLREPHVAIVGDSDGLRSSISEADQSDDAAARRSIYARSWCGLVGEDASQRVADTIQQLLGDAPASSLALDAWGSR